MESRTEAKSSANSSAMTLREFAQVVVTVLYTGYIDLTIHGTLFKTLRLDLSFAEMCTGNVQDCDVELRTVGIVLVRRPSVAQSIALLVECDAGVVEGHEVRQVLGEAFVHVDVRILGCRKRDRRR